VGKITSKKELPVDNEALVFESQIQETHWWFTGRRCLFGKIIRRLGLDSDSRILDLGSGSGTNLSLLRSMNFKNIQGLDISPTAVELCRQRGFEKVVQGNICETGQPSGHYDLVLATDVLEHVDDDRAALREIRRLLKRGRSALLAVPSFPVLWGLQDRVSFHRRRYQKGELMKKVVESGLKPRRHRYFNFMLCPPIMVARLLLKRHAWGLKSENQINTPFLNKTLSGVFLADIFLTEQVPVPFGVSEYCLVEPEP